MATFRDLMEKTMSPARIADVDRRLAEEISAAHAPTFGEPCPGPMNDGTACPFSVDAVVHHNEGVAALCEGHLLTSQFIQHDGKGGLEQYQPRVERRPDVPHGATVK
jgi:hypothetical protein